jgi:hypothetical protein
MKTLFATVSLLSLFAAPALAGDGRISDHSLARMGLQGMQPISDAQGMAIRGTAYASVSGYTNILGVVTQKSKMSNGSPISISISSSFLGVVSASTSAHASAH